MANKVEYAMLKSLNVSNTFLRFLLPFQRYKNLKIVDLRKISNVTEYNFRSHAIRWQMLKIDKGPFLQFFIFAKVRPVLTKVGDRHRIGQARP